MSYFVVDTNVPIVANKQSSQASSSCVVNCIKNLLEIQDHHTIVLDNNWEIIKEYKLKLSQTGQPGAGDAFLKWVLTNRGNINRCNFVEITPTVGSFQEFPETEDLEKFDKSDRKFVAVALVHPHKPPIVNASDSDWRIFELAFNQIGIIVIFLCPELKPRL
jgi:hypothetical protein